MTGRAAIAIAALTMLGCTRHDIRQAVDTREENVDHQRLDPLPPSGIGSGAVETYTLRPGESYRMPQLHTAPSPVLGDREQRQELALTTVCVQAGGRCRRQGGAQSPDCRPHGVPGRCGSRERGAAASGPGGGAALEILARRRVSLRAGQASSRAV